MNGIRYALACSILFYTMFAESRPLSDSLPVEGHFSQAGSSVSRFKLERFLLKQDSSVELADRSLGYKWSGHVVGAALWCVNLGVSAYELNQVLEEVRKQNSLLDSTGKQVALSNSLYKFTIPLTIGSEAASFVQSLLYNRSDYLLHKAALAYNASLAEKFPGRQALDLHIEKDKYGMYKQAGLLMTEPVLYGVLREQPASRACANWSRATQEIGIQTGSWAGMYIGLAILSYIWGASGDTSIIIDKKARDNNLRIGVSLAGFAIVNAIVSAVTRNAGIKRYNEALPKRQAAPAAAPAGAPDSTATGIHEGPAKEPPVGAAARPTTLPVDTAGAKKE
jgi:hypothetical protein